VTQVVTILALDATVAVLVTVGLVTGLAVLGTATLAALVAFFED
jgi:hypothetical protein